MDFVMSKLNWVSAMMLGAAVGSAITMVIDPVDDKRRRKLHKNVGVMAKTVSGVLDAVMDAKR